jgi:EPS-associated MarR family transcriptional regulator
MTSRRAKLHQDTNFRLMKILEANPDLSQREMGKALGISFGGINYCLNALVAKGLVKIENFSQNQNKFGYVYLLTPSGIAEKAALTSVFLKFHAPLGSTQWFLWVSPYCFGNSATGRGCSIGRKNAGRR